MFVFSFIEVKLFNVKINTAELQLHRTETIGTLNVICEKFIVELFIYPYKFTYFYRTCKTCPTM